MQEMSPSTQEAFRQVFATIEQQYGPIESFSVCQSFEDSPTFQATIMCGCQPHDDAFECAAYSLDMPYDEAIAREIYCQCACHDNAALEDIL